MTTYIVEITSDEAYARMLSGGGAARAKRYLEIIAENEKEAREKAEKTIPMEEAILRIIKKDFFVAERKDEERRCKQRQEERKKEHEKDLQIRAERKQQLDMTVKELLQKIQTEINSGHLNENAKVYKGSWEITDVKNFNLKVDNDGDLKFY